jgi:exopolysaccharide biosynthesis polyprenyl glycosylphosphotransferase
MCKKKQKRTKAPNRLRPGERQVILLLGDIFISILALLIALYFWAQRDSWLHFSWEFLKTRPPFWFYLLPILWLVLLIEIYDVRRAGRRDDTFKGIAVAALISAIIYLIIYFTSQPNSLPRRGVLIFLVSVAIFTLIWRLIYIRVFTGERFMRNVLVVGAGRAGTNLVHIIHAMKPKPFNIVGFIDDDPKKLGTHVEGCNVVGSSNDLLKICNSENITDLIFSITGQMAPPMFRALVDAEENGIEVTTMPMVYEELLGRVPIFLLQSEWLLRSFVDQYHTNGFYEVSKRFLDMLGGLIGTVFFFAFFPLITISILFEGGFPILIRQNRLGKSGREYQILKFRTMRKDAESDGQARMAAENDERVTRMGRFWRKSHLDELPQFMNVLKGEMSLVGPRAERPEFVALLQERIPFYRARLFVKPGLTGWAQINQRYAATIEESGVKLEYDLYYIKKRNLVLDFYVLIRTLGQVISLKGQ